MHTVNTVTDSEEAIQFTLAQCHGPRLPAAVTLRGLPSSPALTGRGPHLCGRCWPLLVRRLLCFLPASSHGP